MPLHCNNTIAMHIASNIVYHELTKHIEVNCHFMREKGDKKEIKLKHTTIWNQIAVFLTKAVNKKQLT